ncbi:MAG: hypothetical protein R3A52_04335 [Polyangiales bacterium]
MEREQEPSHRVGPVDLLPDVSALWEALARADVVGVGRLRVDEDVRVPAEGDVHLSRGERALPAHQLAALGVRVSDAVDEEVGEAAEPVVAVEAARGVEERVLHTGDGLTDLAARRWVRLSWSTSGVAASFPPAHGATSSGPSAQWRGLSARMSAM